MSNIWYIKMYTAEVMRKHICIHWRKKESYMAQLWRAKVRLIETTISKKADSGNYSFVQLGLRERLIGNL